MREVIGMPEVIVDWKNEFISHKGIHAGSYFGLDLFETKAHHAIRLKVGHKNQRHLELFVSTDAVTWVGKWSDN